MNPEQALLIGGLIAALVLLWASIRKEHVVSEQERKAIASLLDKGLDLSLNGYHLYRSNKGKDYVLLHFDAKGNLHYDDEESFDDVNDAISKFLQRTQLAA